jgi:hypothetical protein
VPVARDDLRRHRIRRQAELLANVLLDPGVDSRVSADGAADPAHSYLFGRQAEPCLRSIQLGDPTGDLEAERDRLCDDAVRATRHQRSPVPNRKLSGRIPDGGQVGRDDPRRLSELDGSRSVVEVLAGHAEVHISRLRLADRLVDDGQKGDDVMPHPLFDLGDLGWIKGSLADLGQGRGRYSAQGRPRFTRQNLYAKPQFEPVPVGPYRPNRRRRVSLDQIGRRLPTNEWGTTRLYRSQVAEADVVGTFWTPTR